MGSAVCTIRHFSLCIISFIIIQLISCSTAPKEDTPLYSDNQQSKTQLVKLGEKLFFDTLLSSTKTVSCATCHKPEYSFSDPVRFSKGVSNQYLERHTPHLINIFSNNSFFWDGRSPSLENQALQPISNMDEMGLPLKEMIKRLENDKNYPKLFLIAFPKSGITPKNVAIAIAEFERTIIADNTPFDKFIAGDKKALSKNEQLGMELFFSKKTNCSKCHSGNNFTDSQFHNTGIIGDDLGRAEIDRHGEFRMRPYPFFHTQKAFKTPSLRNISLTAPYMHNGALETLEEVLDTYNKGGQDQESYGISLDIKPLGLTTQEIENLLIFLKQSLLSPTVFSAPASASVQILNTNALDHK